MKRMLISVCMITYKHEEFIKDSLLSILKQKVDFDLELIISDDCSPDRTENIVENIIEECKNNPKFNIKYFKQKENVGVAKNFVSALQKCKGKYIALCEGDDYWIDSLKLQKQVNFLESNPEYVLTHHDAKIIDENNNLLNVSKLPKSYQRDYSEYELKNGPFLLTLSLCFRNKIKKYPLEMFDCLNGDKWIISLLGDYGKGKYLPEIKPAAYRVHSGGVWSSVSIISRHINLFKTFTQLGKYYSRIQEEKLVTNFNRKASSEIFKVLNFYWRQKNYKKFLENLQFFFKESSDSLWNKYKIFVRSLIS